MSDDENLPAIPPLTPEELEDELFRAESKAQLAFENVVASDFLASNLLLVLHHSQVIDGHRFLDDLSQQLKAQSPQALSGPLRTACEHKIEDLRKILLAAQTGQGVH